VAPRRRDRRGDVRDDAIGDESSSREVGHGARRVRGEVRVRELARVLRGCKGRCRGYGELYVYYLLVFIGIQALIRGTIDTQGRRTRANIK
jgi:hypothetical protein